MARIDFRRNEEESKKLCMDLPPYVGKMVSVSMGVYVPSPDIEIRTSNVEDVKELIEHVLPPGKYSAICLPTISHVGCIMYLIIVTDEGAKLIVKIDVDLRKQYLEDGSVRQLN